MKKLIFILSITATCLTASAQVHTISQVPATVQNAMQMNYPSVTSVTWEEESGFYRPIFTYNGARVKLLIDLKGKVIHTSTQIAAASLPAAALAYINGQTVSDAEKLMMINGSTRYEAIANGQDMLFDANGNFLKLSHSPLKQ